MQTCFMALYPDKTLANIDYLSLPYLLILNQELTFGGYNGPRELVIPYVAQKIFLVRFTRSINILIYQKLSQELGHEPSG